VTIVGYARVSTARQDESAQVQALREAGCEQVFQERVSTMVPSAKREQLQAALAVLEAGDELVVAKLDRLGSTKSEVVARLAELSDRGVYVETLDGLFNTGVLRRMALLVIGLLTGCQFTSGHFVARLQAEEIKISWSGRKRCYDNILVERLWRTVKYEEVYLHAYNDGWDAEISLARFLWRYCHVRPHSSLGGRTPYEVYTDTKPCSSRPELTMPGAKTVQ
jgi:putative transposase